MNALRPIAQRADFVTGPRGAALRLVTAPADGPQRGTVLLCPPFAEELNKSRRALACFARAAAAEGWCVVQRDLHGCGDSAGEFAQADWAGWQQELLDEVAAAPADRPLVLWALRAGALFLDALQARRPDAHVLLWQPVIQGAQHLQQFLRLHAGARIVGSAKAGDGPSPAQRLKAGDTVEIGGYALAPAVAGGLEQARWTPGPGHGRVAWLETAETPATEPSPVVRRALEALALAQRDAAWRCVPGEPFWMTQEIREAAALQAASLDWLRALPAADPSPSPAPAPAADPDHPEEALAFDCGGERLWGVLSRPSASAPRRTRGVLIIVGGPQYRVGSHRQFVQLARRLRDDGWPVLRFDYRGMGDAHGALRGFESVGEDIAAATAALRAACPALEGVVLWGLCDAASAALMAVPDLPGVAGLALLNPWARSAQSFAATQARHYYGARLLDAAFWRKLLSGGVDLRAAVAGAARAAWALATRRRTRGAPAAGALDFRQRMAHGLRAFPGPVLLMLSGEDLTAREFHDHAAGDAAWRGLLTAPRVRTLHLEGADHTLSSRAWQDRMEAATLAWLQEPGPDAGRQRMARTDR
jgi:exosortase A-associated hydrolase 1/exosortase A-associated hydrolase 2